MLGLHWALLVLPAAGRLGAPNASADNASADFLPGGAGRGLDYWRNSTMSLNAMSSESLPGKMGYPHMATTTRYGDTCCASCGSINTAKLVQGTNFYAVAAAESMQRGGIGDGHFCTHDGSGDGGTVGMGCGSCGKGRFIASHPMDYPLWAQPGEEIFENEINFVVADTCPHHGNEAWCPRSAGSSNKFGHKNHFDFANPPHKFDNYYFAWSKMDCPEEIKQRFGELSSC